MNKILVILFILFVISFITSAQEKQGGTVSGKVIDAATKKPIEYANIVVLNVSDTSVVTGTVTNDKGVFNLTGV